MKYTYRFALSVSMAAVAALAACARDDLLGVSTPDAITPGNLNSADGAEGLRVGAIQRFKLMTALDESSWFYGGMLVDEWKSADTFIQRDETDQRTVSEDNSLVTTAYRDIHRARIQSFQAAQALETYKPAAKGEIGEMWFVKGMAELQSASDFCNGQPFADLSSGSPDLGTPVSGADAFKLALASFDSALAVVGTATDSISLRVKYSAQVGRGRAFLGLGQQSQAGAAIAGVPKTFSFNLTWPATQGKEDNLIWGLASSARRYTVQDSADRQGGRIPNAMPFVSAKDPRVPTVQNPKFGFDGSTPFDGQLVFPNFNSPVPVANYVDAQLILAEAQGGANAVSIINAMRAAVSLKPYAGPTDAASIKNLVIDERRRVLFLEGQRNYDIQRFSLPLNPATGTVYPRVGGTYGTTTCLPLPDVELFNNPNATR